MILFYGAESIELPVVDTRPAYESRVKWRPVGSTWAAADHGGGTRKIRTTVTASFAPTDAVAAVAEGFLRTSGLVYVESSSAECIWGPGVTLPQDVPVSLSVERRATSIVEGSPVLSQVSFALRPERLPDSALAAPGVTTARIHVQSVSIEEAMTPFELSSELTSASGVAGRYRVSDGVVVTPEARSFSAEYIARRADAGAYFAAVAIARTAAVEAVGAGLVGLPSAAVCLEWSWGERLDAAGEWWRFSAKWGCL